MENFNQKNPEKQNNERNIKNLNEILEELKTSGITVVEDINETEDNDNVKISFRFQAQLASVFEHNQKLADIIRNDPELPAELKDNFGINVVSPEKGFEVVFSLNKNKTELKEKAREVLEKIKNSLTMNKEENSK